MLAASAKEISLDANLAAVSPLKACKWHSLFLFKIFCNVIKCMRHNHVKAAAARHNHEITTKRY